MKRYAAGIDVGNATTEAALGCVDENGLLQAVVSGISGTTGLKGTKENKRGILHALSDACSKLGICLKDINALYLNEATPVIGDFAMETITETIITESTMIGHNPDTPGGLGLGVGISIRLEELPGADRTKNYIVLVDDGFSFDEAALQMNQALEQGCKIVGAIVQKDDGVLIANRVKNIIPVIDEVRLIENIPLGALCAVEVAAKGATVERLSNPYGIAGIFSLSPEETEHVIFVAKALIGSRSAVVLKTPKGQVEERIIPAGEIIFCGEHYEKSVAVDAGAEAVMEAQEKVGVLLDVKGSAGTNVGGMLSSIKATMAQITGQQQDTIRIQDILAVDTMASQSVAGAMAGEYTMEHSVAIAAMVKTHKLNMEQLASEVTEAAGILASIGGVEGDMAARGALTTPGTDTPICIVDIGAGSTDACYFDKDGYKRTVHLAGAGDMVSAMICSELGLDSIEEAENIKKYRLAKAESLFYIRYEDGSVEFFQKPLESRLFARVAIVRDGELIPLETRHSMERIRQVRREVKQKVLVENALRALKKVSPTGRLYGLSHVVLLGGSSLDFELANMLTEALSHYGITAGKGDVRGCEGPRNAVATGLLLSALEEEHG